MNTTFRALRADEVDVRIGTVKEGKGVSLLLYKDARCDMNILDETVGSTNWQKHYSRDNANCTVSIWDDDKKQWIGKEDTGTESNTEAEKGLASDSFKRACFCWGIGRELYTAPFIWIPGATKNDRFWVSDMTVDGKRITALTICRCNQYGDKTQDVAYSYPRYAVTAPKPAAPAPQPAAPQQTTLDQMAAIRLSEKEIMTLEALAAQKGVPVEQICQRFHLNSLNEMTSRQYVQCLSALNKSGGQK